MQKTLALFPGQGAQAVGMGQSLCENFSIARETFEEASEACKKNLRDLCINGPESELMLTENTQPCLVTVAVAAFRVAERETGFRPTLVAGHSLGEYSALVAAGALSLSDAASWAQQRGSAMQKAVPAGKGRMVAVLGLEDAAVGALCEKATVQAKELHQKEGGDKSIKTISGVESAIESAIESIVQPANFNAPGQVVIAGSTDAIEKALALLQSGAFPGGKAIPLAVSAPFHCKLMGPAKKTMAELFQRASNPKALKCPYVPNCTARITSEPGVIFDLLIQQIDHPVLWRQSIEVAIDSGYHQAFEFGPGKVLQGLCKRIAKPLGAAFDVGAIGDLDSFKHYEALLSHCLDRNF